MIRIDWKPLTGKDSSPKFTSDFLALAGTVLFWLLLLTVLCIVKPSSNKKYNQVQIVLASTPVVKKSDSSPAEAASSKQTEKSQSQKQSQSEKQTQAQKNTQTEKTSQSPKNTQSEKPTQSPRQSEKKVEKTATSAKPVENTSSSKPSTEPKKQSTVAKTEPVQTYKSVEEQMAEQFNSKPKKAANFNWDSFDDSSSDSIEKYSDESDTKKVLSKNSLSGNSGEVSSDSPKQSVSSTSNLSSVQTSEASKSTSDALKSISNSTFNGNAVNGVQSSTSVKAAKSGSGTLIAMSDGSSRTLINPGEPVINLSKEAAATIDGTREVEITFLVTESGNVPRAQISIKPEAVLSPLVKNEILDQISHWRFSAASYTSVAKMGYKIVKR